MSLTLRDSSGATVKRRVERLKAEDIKIPARPSFEFRLLEGGIAYVSLNTMSDEAVVQQFDSRFAEISKAKALIIDLRRNGGGNSEIGWRILAYLTDRPFATHLCVNRKYDPYRARPRVGSLDLHSQRRRAGASRRGPLHGTGRGAHQRAHRVGRRGLLRSLRRDEARRDHW